ncbi:MAG: hypothetical protein JRN52_05085 [Nitrososphaerota archaeon]|nr:hypothetical protein [Nitrososphaerota archaeon]
MNADQSAEGPFRDLSFTVFGILKLPTGASIALSGSSPAVTVIRSQIDGGQALLLGAGKWSLRRNDKQRV